MADPVLQKGIYYRRRESPPRFFALMLLDARRTDGAVDADVDAASVHSLLQELWKLWAKLESGEIHDLPDVTVPHGFLDTLLGFAPAAFDLNGRAKVAPADLVGDFGFQPPIAREEIVNGDLESGGPIADGDVPSGIEYVADVDARLSSVHFAVQFTARTPLAVERAVVETWKFLSDPERTPQPSVLEIAGVFTGSQRDDSRSWIDFHDGTSNLTSEEREIVIPVPDKEPDDPEAWTARGTYLAFIRLSIDLGLWQRCLGKSEQERLVGRDKITGCPLRFDDLGDPRVVPDCSGWRPERNAPPPAEPVESMTHIHRTRKDQRVGDPNSHRIYRQGYPYFEPIPDKPYFRVGLNFVSFQNTPQRLIGMLTVASWLGQTNFGASDEAHRNTANPGQWPGDPIRRLVSAYATGMFFVPPVVAGELFPGAAVLVPAG